MEGSLSVTSPGPMQGATFMLSLPPKVAVVPGVGVGV
jgi:hypothetical protein